MNQKIDAQLSLSLSLTEEEREKNPLLSSGFQADTGLWKLILFYNGSLEEIKGEISFEYIPLLGNFAILFIKSEDISRFIAFPQVLYLELSRPLYLDAITGIDASCFPSGTSAASGNTGFTGNNEAIDGGNLSQINNKIDKNYFFKENSSSVFRSLTGRGTAVAILDSGVDYRHPDFRNTDGSTRILAYWDQTLPFRTTTELPTTAKNSSLRGKNLSKETAPTDAMSTRIIPEEYYLPNPYRLGAIFSESALNDLLESNNKNLDFSDMNSDTGSGESFFSGTTDEETSFSGTADEETFFSDITEASGSNPDSRMADEIPASLPLLSPSDDSSGHGTHVAGICAGNGRASGGKNRGAAPEASLIVVKLKNESDSVYTDYANLMMAADFAVQFAAEKNLPLAVNISYGSNDGSHTGTSLIELFLEQSILYGKNCVVAATGNEGLTRRHANVKLFPGEMRDISFTVAPGEKNIYLELWQPYADTMEYSLLPPSDTEPFPFPNLTGIYDLDSEKKHSTANINNPASGKNNPSANTDTPGSGKNNPSANTDTPDSGRSNTEFVTSDSNKNISEVGIKLSSSAADSLRLVVAGPTPYQTARQYFLSITPAEGKISITAGTWRLNARAVSIFDGSLQLWLPGKEATASATGFISPSSTMTFTIPSTASGIISVSGYNSSTDTYASFSGSGFTGIRETKPDLCAPAVNILSAAPGGGYSVRTGTSMAAPFVTGAAALLMQYGIVNGNDPFLYGEKIKACLWRGAQPLPAFSEYPNAYTGWGALCARESLPD